GCRRPERSAGGGPRRPMTEEPPMVAKHRPDRDRAIERPAAITADPAAVEILSVWLSSDETNMVLIKPETWAGLAPWALLLADIARYIAYVHAASTGTAPARAIAGIKSILDAELDSIAGPRPEADCGSGH